MRCSRPNTSESFGRRFRYPRPMESRAVRPHGTIRMPGLALDPERMASGARAHRVIDHYNGWRPHRSLDLAPPNGRTSAAPWTATEPITLKRRDRLGGLLHEYQRA